MSKQIHFRATDVDVKRLAELMEKLGTTLTAVIREAIRLFHKKEIQNVNKVILVFALCIAASSCGGAQVVMPQDGGIDPNPTPTPTPVVIPTPTPPPTFPPAQPETCTGDILIGGGEQCSFSDGSTFYHLEQFSVAVGANGHGTFQIISEAGINQGGLKQITLTSPIPLNVLEVHGTGSINSWCPNNGVLTTWDATAPDGTIVHIVGAKEYFFNGGGEKVSYVIPQTVFPSPLPIQSFTQNIFIDLCSVATVHWVLNGSF